MSRSMADALLILLVAVSFALGVLVGAIVTVRTTETQAADVPRVRP
jgi:uncharacterized protein YneF (UPF0154 family)